MRPRPSPSTSTSLSLASADDLLRFVTLALAKLAPDVPLDDLTTDSSITDLEIESVTVVELIALVEEELDLSLPDDELTHIDSVRDLAACIGRQVARV